MSVAELLDRLAEKAHRMQGVHAVTSSDTHLQIRLADGTTVRVDAHVVDRPQEGTTE